MQKIKCDNCGKTFQRRKSHIGKNKFCCAKCYLSWKKTKSPKGKDHYNFKQLKTNCVVCGQEFYAKRHRLNNSEAKYCSHKCEGKHRQTKFKIKCLVCGADFFSTPSRTRKYCSQKCMGVAMSGENSKWWNGGISNIKQKIRNSAKYYSWRQDVFMRDDFTCQECGVKGGYLEAHHIKSFSGLYSEALHCLPLLNEQEACLLYSPMWDIKIGKTLCKKCHKSKYHNWKIDNEKY